MRGHVISAGLAALVLALGAGLPASATAADSQPAPAPAPAMRAGHAVWHTYSNVRISSRSGDCDGLSVQWQQTPRADGVIALTGTVFDAAGNCPGRQLDLADGRLDPRTGALSFDARTPDTGQLALRFQGRRVGSRLIGQFAYARETTGELDGAMQVTLRAVPPGGLRRLDLPQR